jgi:hypothetical protein
LSRPNPAIRSGRLIRTKAVIRGIPPDYSKGRIKAAQCHRRPSKFMRRDGTDYHVVH